MLKVDDEMVEVPETHAWNPVLMEDRFDLHVSWAKAASLSFTAKIANGVKILLEIRSQSPDINYLNLHPIDPPYARRTAGLGKISNPAS